MHTSFGVLKTVLSGGSSLFVGIKEYADISHDLPFRVKRLVSVWTSSCRCVDSAIVLVSPKSNPRWTMSTSVVRCPQNNIFFIKF